MCQRNWPKYNANLVQRGSLSFFCHPSIIKLIKKSRKSHCQTGRPPYSNQMIILLILLKISYGLTYRRCQGMALGLFSHHGIPVPSYSTICRGIQRLNNILPRLSRRRPKKFIVDSSGFKVAGEGEWKTKIHGQSYHRSWVKVHLLIDSKTNEIVDLVLTPPTEPDVNIGLKFLEQIPSSGQVLADGAYDGQRFRQKAYSKGIIAIVPPPINAQIRRQDCFNERNDALRMIELFGNDKVARSLWGKLTGYCHRVKVESAFSRMKRLFGSSVFSRVLRAQKVELWLKALLSNMWLNEN